MKMDDKIAQVTRQLEKKIIERRRDFHQFAEVGWTEFRTASIVASELERFGYQVFVGDDVIEESQMMGVPNTDELSVHMTRAIAQGGNADWISKMKGGKTGVVGILEFAKPGPTVALRFDLDANDITETESSEHKPHREQFASVNHGAMHACAHDGHCAIGLGVAEILSQLRDDLSGKVKLIFQPAEEGVRGAKAMVAKGIVDDVDYLIGMHLGVNLRKTGQISCNVSGFLPTSKYDAVFTGTAAHAGMAPQDGRNALLAAAMASLNLHAISRHSQGTSRINVGVMQAGTGRNVIPQNALIKFETRGQTTEINQFMTEEARRIINCAASMYGVTVTIQEMGESIGGESSFKLANDFVEIVKRLGNFDDIILESNLGGSDDCSYFMKRVQENGGQAAYLLVGAELAAGHHNSLFDFDEAALPKAVQLLSVGVAELLAQH